MRRAVNFRIAAFALIGVVCGILISYFRIRESLIGVIATAGFTVAFFILFTFFSSAKFKNTGKILCLLFFALFLSFGYFGFWRIADKYANANLGGHILTVTGDVSEISENDNYSYVLVDDVTFSGAVKGKTHYKMALSVYGESGLRLGDEISFTAAVSDRTLIYDGKFSADALAQDVKYLAEVNAEDVAINKRSPNLFQKCNLYIFDTLKSGLKAEQFAVAYAMLTGNSDYMATENLEAYRNLGVAHIFAVSGLHIGFLATAVYFPVYFLLNKCKVNRYAAFIITLFATVFYAGVCGFSASSVRAVIMFFFLNVARLSGMKYDALSAVFSAAFFILLVSPAELFCAGFLLSFSVVITIIVLYNPLTRLLKFLPKKLAMPLATSLSAEIGSAPVLLCFFNRFPAMSLFINILFVPIAGVIFTALIVGLLLGAIITPTITLFVQGYALFGLDYFIKLLDLKIFLIGGFSLGVYAVAYYGAVAVSGGLINFKRVAKIIVCMVLCVTVVCGTVIKTINERKEITATVIGSDYLSAVLLKGEGDNLLVISDVSYKYFSRYRLGKALQFASDEKVTVVLLNQEDEVDLSAFIVRLYGIMNIERFYYYGERDYVAEKIIANAFNGLEAISLRDGDGINALGGKFELALNGKCFYTSVCGGVAVFSPIAGSMGYKELNFAPYTIIACDSYGVLFKAFSPEKMVSFRSSQEYPDGESQGNFRFVLGN